MRANIPFVATGQTFRSWMSVTNEIANQINQASDTGFSNGLVRYDSTGALNISNFSSPSITINGKTITNVSDDFSTPYANTLVSAMGILNLVDSRSNTVYDTNTIIRATPTTLTGRVDNTPIFSSTDDLLTVHANTLFDQNVHITGNFSVNGSSVSIETTQLAIEDRVITLNKNAPGGLVDGSGFEIEGTVGSTSVTYDHVNKGFDLTANGTLLKLVTKDDLRVDFDVSPKNYITFDQELKKASNVQFEEITANSQLVIPVVTVIPATGIEGEIIFDTANNEFIGYDGTKWHNLGEGAVASAVSTVSGNTYVEANNVTESIEFVANNFNIMDLTSNSMAVTANTITLFNHSFEGVSSNLYSNAVSTDLVTGKAIKDYVDEEANTLNTVITDLTANVAEVANTLNNKIASINSATITIGTLSMVPYGNPMVITNVGDNIDAEFNFEIPYGPTGISLDSVTKKSNNEIKFNFDNGSNTVIDFNFGRLEPLSLLQKNTVFGQDYELRALTDSGGNFSGDLTIWDPNSSPNPSWIDIEAGTGTPSANTTKFFGVNSDISTNEISYLEGGVSDVLNTDDYDVWSLGTAIKFELQDNNLVLVTS
jgi:hypothetical protein